MNELDRNMPGTRSLRERAAGFFSYLAALEDKAELSLVETLQLRLSYMERRLVEVEIRLNGLNGVEARSPSLERHSDRRRVPPGTTTA